MKKEKDPLDAYCESMEDELAEVAAGKTMPSDIQGVVRASFLVE